MLNSFTRNAKIDLQPLFEIHLIYFLQYDLYISLLKLKNFSQFTEFS